MKKNLLSFPKWVKEWKNKAINYISKYDGDPDDGFLDDNFNQLNFDNTKPNNKKLS